MFWFYNLGLPLESVLETFGNCRLLKQSSNVQKAPLKKIRHRPLAAGFAIVLWSLFSGPWSSATDFVLIHSSKDILPEQEQIQTAVDFYGLNLRVVSANPRDNREIAKVVQRNETVGVAVAADALGALNQGSLFRSLSRAGGKSIPLLIFGVGPDTDPGSLKNWSGGTVSDAQLLRNPLQPGFSFGRVDGLTLQLTGLQTPLSVREIFCLVLNKSASVHPVISLFHDDQVSPSFVEANVQQRKVFVASALTPSSSFEDGADSEYSTFLRLAPALMFVRYCAGERGWHALHHYANFTVDDPWLRQPYGFVDYQRLLEEMEKHDFHTTIAFIPWNYNRSEPEVVSLFRNHPDKFSIAIHGNNHDHKEFTNYRSKPLEVQIGDLAQSLYRMERFRTLTGIPYDKVMIFPHSIAPEATVEALRGYNFLATVNSSNVPEGSTRPAGDLFALRSVTLFFGGIPSISRYSAAVTIPHGLLAIQEFLDNPLLFYAHSDLFATGMNAFDRVADDVNGIEPDTRWRSLGEIVKHLFLVKLRDDSNYDLLAFSNNIDLDNISGRETVFYIKKQEPNPKALKSVEVDGQPVPYQVQNGYLSLNIHMPIGSSRNLAIQYASDSALAAAGKSTNSVVVYFLRMGSDFRDIYLGRSKVGLAIIRAYNAHNLKPWQVLVGLFVLLLLCTYSAYRLHRFVSTRRGQLKGAEKWSAAN